jgi:hypothetical protein
MAVLQVWCSVVIVAVYGTIATVTASVPVSSSPGQDLIIGLVSQQWSSQARAGIDDALDDINNNTELLSGYKLKYIPVSVTKSEVIED